MLLHNEDCLKWVNKTKIIDALKSLKSLGLTKEIGISSYEPEKIPQICNNYGFKVVQAPANIFDNRLFNKNILTQLISQNVEVHVRSVFLQGVLLRNPLKKNLIPHDLRKYTINFRRKCQIQGLNPLSVAISHITRQSKKIKIIVGVTCLKELHEILYALEQNENIENYKIPKWSKIFDPRKWSDKV